MSELYTPKLASLRRRLTLLEKRKGDNKECDQIRAEVRKLEKLEVPSRLTTLRARLKASDKKPGYEKRSREIKKEIERLERIQQQEYDL